MRENAQFCHPEPATLRAKDLNPCVLSSSLRGHQDWSHPERDEGCFPWLEHGFQPGHNHLRGNPALAAESNGHAVHKFGHFLLQSG
jgi:hypothetical protein